MNIIACYKIVPFEESIVIRKDRSLSFENAELVIGQYDLNAIEAGARLVGEHGGELVALTAGSGEVENSKLRKAVLSRGPSRCVTVNDPSLTGADSSAVSAVLAEAVRSVGEYDLILCGEGSSDLYAQQVGVQLGERLGLPVINAVTSIKYSGDRLAVKRIVGSETETLSVALPAVISVSSGINVTRVPSMKDILAAGKKPVRALTGSDIAIPADRTTDTVETLAPNQTERKRQIFEGDGADTVSAFLQAISAELR